MKTLTEKRFFEWHEDDVSVTLRNKGGSYGGGRKYLSFVLFRHGRIIVPRRLSNRQYVNQDKLIIEVMIADEKGIDTEDSVQPTKPKRSIQTGRDNG